MVAEGKAVFHLVQNLEGPDLKIFQEGGINSILLVPVIIDGVIRGAAGLPEKKFNLVWNK